MPESKKRIISDIVPAEKSRAEALPMKKTPPVQEAPIENVIEEKAIPTTPKRSGPKPRRFDNSQLDFLRKNTAPGERPTQPARPQRNAGTETSQGSNIPGKKFLVAGASLIVLVLLYVLLSVFSSATVEITAKESQFKLSRPVTFTLPYEEIRISESGEKDGKSINTETVNQKAHGEIAIYNAFSSSSQVLVINTRFRTKEGNIYRIQKQVMVPGATVVDGEITPSKIITEVVSDTEGEEFNVESGTTFDIPGFVGGPRYEKFYGEAVEPIDGGFVGEVKIVGESEAGEALKSAEADAITTANNILRDSIPEGLVALAEKEISVADSSIEPSIGDPGEKFTAKATATGSFVLIDEEKLLSELEELLFDDFPGAENNLRLIDNTGIVLIKKDSSTGEAIFELREEINVSWLADEEMLTTALSKVKVKQIPDVFKQYEAILSAEVKFSPSWWRRIPSKPGRIHVEYR